MRVHRNHPAAVGDLDQIAIAARVVGGEDHAPCGSRPDRRPRRRRQVDARVEAGATRAERAADRRLQRPGERDRAARQRRPEGAESAGAGDAVRRQVRPALELDQRALGVAAEAAVDGGIWKAVPRECELELGDVPAGHASREAARAQHVPREAAEGASGLWAGDPVRGQSMEALEAHHGRGRRPSGDPVDRAPVDVVVPKRHLQRRDGRTSGGVRRRSEHEGTCRDRGCELDMAETRHHSNEGSAGSGKSLVSTYVFAGATACSYRAQALNARKLLTFSP